MDAAIQSIILGLVTNGIAGILGSAGNTGINLLVGEELLDKMAREETSLFSVLRRASEDAATVIEDYGSPTTEVICSYLQSPAAQALLQEFYSLLITSDTIEGGTSGKWTAIREKFRLELLEYASDYDGVDGQAVESCSYNIFIILLRCCCVALDEDIARGSLTALNAVSQFRHEMLMGALIRYGSGSTTSLLTSAIDTRAMLSFEAAYHRQVVVRHGRITSSYLGAPEPKPIEQLYVSPTLVKHIDEEGQRKPSDAQLALFASTQVDATELAKLVATLNHAVVLGDPGGGKSTMATKICHDIAHHYKRKLCAERELTPILIVLREYAEEKRVANRSIVQFIEYNIRSRYQISQVPEHAIEYLLAEGRVMVVFDGLDELLDMRYRQEVRDDIECFCNIYPDVPVLVTSRKVGYDQSPLDGQLFAVYQLAPFDDDQVEEYTTKWFGADPRLTPSERDKRIAAFLRESRSVRDIRSNPLLLSLMCYLFRAENYIPQNRPQLYNKCATTLFESWDKSRGIEVPFPYESKFAPTIEYLAFAIYTDIDLQRGATEERLQELAVEFLHPIPIANRDKAESVARSFITFCRTRAWVFTATGSTKQGEELYEFTHRTFLEFFAASYLVTVKHTPSMLAKALLPKIARAEWDMVAQIAFQLLSKRVRGGSDSLLSVLLRRAEKSKWHERLNLLSFATHCLGFLVLDPQLVNRVVQASIELCVARSIEWHGIASREERYRSYRDHFNDSGEARAVERLLEGLVSISSDNIEAAIECAEPLLSTEIDNVGFGRADASVDLCETLADRVVLDVLRSPEETTAWNYMRDRIFDTKRDRIVELSRGSFNVAYDAYLNHLIDAVDIVQRHGLKSLFELRENSVLWGRGKGELAQGLISTALGPIGKTWLLAKWPQSDIVKDLSRLGRFLTDLEVPWVSSDSVSSLYATPHFLTYFIEYMLPVFRDSAASDVVESYVDLGDPNILFAAIALLAIYIEANEQRPEHKVPSRKIRGLIERGDVERSVNTLKGLQSLSYARYLGEILGARTLKTPMPKDSAELQGSPLTHKQKHLIIEWANRKVNFLSSDAHGIK